MKINWIAKLTSRKLWVAVAGMVAGFALAFGAEAEVADTISGCILSVASVVGYIFGEGLVDANRPNDQAQQTPMQAEYEDLDPTENAGG